MIGVPEQAQLFDDDSRDVAVLVRLKGIRVGRPRQFGKVYLALALWRGIGLEDLCEQLLPIGKERIAWAKMAAVLATARFCEPSSELHIAGIGIGAQHLAICFSSVIRRSTRIASTVRSIICSCTSKPSKRTCRSVAESCSCRTTTCCCTTSAYFEGQAEANPQAQRGVFPRLPARLQAGTHRSGGEV